MGIIITKGFASRLVEYDQLVTSVRFRAETLKADEAIRKVMGDSERFLQELKKGGMDTSKIEAGNNKVEEEKRFGEANVVNASRTIRMRTVYDPAFIEGLMQVIEQGGFDADLSFKPSISDIEDIRSELMKEAAMQARKKAKDIAEIMGASFMGLEKMETDLGVSRVSWDLDEENAFDESQGVAMKKLVSAEDEYSRLGKPQMNVEVEVSAEWRVE